MSQQLELPLWKPRDATPEEAKQWQEEELAVQAKYAMHTVVAASIIQVSALLFMFSMFWVIDKIVG